MREYSVHFIKKDLNHQPGEYGVLARDVKHAIQQCQELLPDVRITSVLPAEMWT